MARVSRPGWRAPNRSACAHARDGINAVRLYDRRTNRRMTMHRVDQASKRASDPRTLEDVGLRLAAIVNSSSDAIIVTDLDDVVSTWNLAAQRLFGYSESEAVGQPITSIIA